MLRHRIALVVVALLAVGAACSAEDGRELPAPVATAPAPTTTAVAAIGGTGGFTLTSPAADAGGEVPAAFTCLGEDVSPPLAWSGAPPAAAYGIVVRDLSAEGFVHWVVAGIDPTVVGLGAGGVPEGAVESLNGTGTAGWAGPCPQVGTGTHTYAFVLHALPEPVVIDPAMSGAEAADLIEGTSTAQAELLLTATAPE